MKQFRRVCLLLALILVLSVPAMAVGNWYDGAVNFAKHEGIYSEDFVWNKEVSKLDLVKSLFTNEKDQKAFIKKHKLDKNSEDLESVLDRKEAAKLLHIYLLEDENLPEPEARGVESMLDFKDVPEEYVEAMRFVYDLGIINGDDLNRLNPNQALKWAELYTILMNIHRVNHPPVKTKVKDISKYGNIILDIDAELFRKADFKEGDLVYLKVNNQLIVAPVGDTYSNVDNGKEVVVINDKEGGVVVAINMGNFAETYGAKKGTEIGISMMKKEGYLDEYEIRSIDKYRTNDREDYASDEVFANFRPIVMGNIPEGTLYRTSSPVNPELGRAAFADGLIAKHGVKTVMNMADSLEELETYFNDENFNSPYYKSLFDDGHVVYLDMTVDFTSDDFNHKLKNGLEFLAKQPGPYAIHCNEGKDRAGFASIVLEALMGGTVEEIREDYMISYENYYFVERGSEQYEKIAASNVMNSLKMIADVETDEELQQVDLQARTKVYLEEVIGMDELTIQKLMNQLSTEFQSEVSIEEAA